MGVSYVYGASGAAHPFKPLGRLGPKSSLKAECTMVGSCAYFSEQGQEVISIVAVIFPERWRSDVNIERSDPHARVYMHCMRFLYLNI